MCQNSLPSGGGRSLGSKISGVVPGEIFLVSTKLDTFCYLTVQTAPCYVPQFWHNTGVWQTDGRNCRIASTALAMRALRRAVKKWTTGVRARITTGCGTNGPENGTSRQKRTGGNPRLASQKTTTSDTDKGRYGVCRSKLARGPPSVSSQSTALPTSSGATWTFGQRDDRLSTSGSCAQARRKRRGGINSRWSPPPPPGRPTYGKPT